MIPGLTFHHIGVACRDLDAEARAFEILGYVQEGDEFIDPIQMIRGRFLVSATGPRVELLVGHGEPSPLAPWLKQGTKMYHLAYEAPSLPAALDALKQARARVVVQPVPAVAFGGREISFLLLPNMLLVEIIQAGA